MAEITPKKLKQTPKKAPKTPIPQTPQTLATTTPRRSSRLLSPPPSSRRKVDPPSLTTPKTSINQRTKSTKNATDKSTKKKLDTTDDEALFSPASPDRTETKKRKTRTENDRAKVVKVLRNSNKKGEGKKKRDGVIRPKRRVYYKKVSYDGGEFAVGDDVYVKRREDASSDDEEPEVEECRVCFRTGRSVMIECDDCLGGFHLKCLKPPLRKVPEEDWICEYCEAKKLGKKVELPEAPVGMKRRRTAKEKLLSSDLWAARIERYIDKKFLILFVV